MKAIAKYRKLLKTILFKRSKRLISLRQIHSQACVHLAFGSKVPKIGLYRAQISDSLLLSGHKIVRIGSRASTEVYWVVSGLEEIPFSVEQQLKWLEKIIRQAPDRRVAIYLGKSREGQRLKRKIALSNVRSV